MASLDHSEATRTVEEPLSIHPNDSQSPLTEKVSSDSTAGSGKPGDDINKSSRKPGNGNKVTLAGEPPLRSSTLDSYPPGRSSRRGTRENSGGNANPNDSEAFDLPPLKKRITSLFASERKIKREPSWAESGKAIVKASWLNVLLVFIPVGWALHFAHVNDTVVFITTFLAIIPLAKLLGFGTEEIALRVGQTLGGLLNATLGNAVELIVAIIALIKCEITVVQSSLLGSILSNLLLVLGMCFFAGGIKFSEQGFKDTAAQLNSSLLVISVIAILIPAGYQASFGSTNTPAAEVDAILKMSRGISLILLIVYGAYLVFQLFTHQHLYVDTPHHEGDADRSSDGRSVFGMKNHRALRQARSARRRYVEEAQDKEEEEEEIPTLSLWAALVLLVGVTVLVAFTAEFLVSSINGLTAAHPQISVEWVGLILLPIVGNAAEHVTAVSVSVHDKIDLSMGVAVGSSIQIALFVIPFMVTLGWILGKPLSLLFDGFESITLFLSVLIVNYTIQDGRSNWLEGFLLMMVYVIIAVAFWFYPSTITPEAALFTC